MHVQRRYTTQLDFAELDVTVTITHIPSDTGGRPSLDVVARQLGGATLRMVAPEGAAVADQDALGHVRRMLHALVDRATRCEPQDAESMLSDIRTGAVRLRRDAVAQDVVDYLLAAPVVATEGSWPKMANLAELVLLVGGLGAASVGLVTGQGDLVDYGGVLTSTGTVLVQVRGLGKPDVAPQGPEPRSEAEQAPSPLESEETKSLSDVLSAVDLAAIDRLGLDKAGSNQVKVAAALKLIESSSALRG